jgi:hypothetical protein
MAGPKEQLHFGVRFASKSDFVIPDAIARLFIDSYEERPDVASEALFIGGNEAGFQSLAELICYSLNGLEDELCLSDLSFIANETERPVKILFEYAEAALPVTNGRVIKNETGIRWALTETEASVAAISLHGLGYAFNHFHFDPVDKGLLAAYCFIEF